MTKHSVLGSCIIVGGGPAGISVAKNLKAKGIDVTVVDRQDYLDWSVASPRSLVSPDDVEKHSYAMPLKGVCEFVGADFVQGAVSKIGPTSVTVANGTVLNADCVVVAIGGQYASGAIWKPTPDQTTKEERIAGFRSERERVKASRSVVIAGAGLAGVEVAGEIKSAYPDKKVTLVGTFLAGTSEGMRKRTKTAITKMGVILSDGRVNESEPGEDGKVTTSTGESIDADLVLNAAGFVFAGAELVDEALATDVTKRGQFNCRATLQLQSCDTVFCCGDIVAVPQGCYADVKGIAHAEATAKTVAANVVKVLSKASPLSDFKWSKKPITNPCMTALGTKVGIGDLGMPRFMSGIENKLCRTMKCKDYYMSLQAKHFGKGKTWD